jgi:Trk K+ transport system NAD-binding subunit
MEELSSATIQLRVRGAIALLVAWAALASALGTEVILGAFLAGVIVNIIAGPGESVLRDRLDALGFGFFIPIFFVNVGTQFDLWSFLGSGKSLILFPLFIAAAYVVKVLPALLYRIAFSWRESLAAGFLLSSRLSLIVAASAMAVRLHVITEEMNAGIILVAMFTCTFSPLLFNRLAPPLMEVRRRGIIVVGLNHLTALLAKRLLQEEEEVSVLGYPADRAKASHFANARMIFGDPTDEVALRAMGADQAAALVAALDDAGANVRLCHMAKERFGIPVVVSRADDHAAMEEMQALGVRVIQPALATAVALEAALRFPATFDVLVQQADNVEVREATLRNASFDEMALRALRLPGNALVIGIRRGGEVIVPHEDTTFRLGDIVMLVGSPNATKEARLLLELSSRRPHLRSP